MNNFPLYFNPLELQIRGNHLTPAFPGSDGDGMSRRKNVSMLLHVTEIVAIDTIEIAAIYFDKEDKVQVKFIKIRLSSSKNIDIFLRLSQI